MDKPKFFKSQTAGNIPLPIFFPDATKAVVRTLDSIDIQNSKTNGILVNTYHLILSPGKNVIKKHGGVRNFMNFKGGVISDSGGFQVMTLAKTPGSGGKVTDLGVTFKPEGGKKMLLTPESSIEFQAILMPDMLVVLDDFTAPSASYDEAKESVERTISWAKRSKAEFEKIYKGKTDKPYLLGVVQGGKYQDLRKYCTQKLVKIGFDGLGYGGWPIGETNNFDYASAQTISENTPENYLLYGLGIGKPNEIVNLAKIGYNIFDCVLPTRDARHKRLYVYTADAIDKINVSNEKFYLYYVPDKEKYYHDTNSVSTACDCLLCKNYSRSYLSHLFRTQEITALRLATIHNLRFYSILMEKIKEQVYK